MSESNNATSSAQQLIQPSVNQSIALAVQSAVDLMRNLNTIETTVIGVASAAWLAEPGNTAYKDIIENATKTITFAVENLAKVGTVGAGVLTDLKPD
ncbi:hypothetical protein A5320_05300 [Rheinheimera sp. SA_1]|jgi:hypothetical protein|uniref:hypothetical protein n=1 Tax=Rheinheimera sp. SA_1 TaxID=1827365 RepID=UPI0007FB9B89|nr:hypothetical protein [Rheinheimera sp. SA_1]OBP16790.1 hypothetical protein A5320_05300 [Rheinheimera sp. SA_1]